MKRITWLAILAVFMVGPGQADNGYLSFNAAGDLVVSGPFDVVIPAPENTRAAGPSDNKLVFLGESLSVSRAGFFRDKEFVVFEIETTDAPSGTISYDRLPVIELAGQEYHTRAFCMELTRADLEEDEDSVLQFIEDQNFDPFPAVHTRQLLIATDDGTAEAVVIFASRVDGGCAEVDADFEASFDARFEKFAELVRAANR